MWLSLGLVCDVNKKALLREPLCYPTALKRELCSTLKYYSYILSMSSFPGGHNGNRTRNSWVSSTTCAPALGPKVLIRVSFQGNVIKTKISKFVNAKNSIFTRQLWLDKSFFFCIITLAYQTGVAPAYGCRASQR